MKREKVIEITDKLVEYCLYGLILSIPISNTAIEIFVSLAILAFIVKKILSFRDSPALSSKAGLELGQEREGQSLSRTHLFLLFFIIFSGLSLVNSGPYLKKGLEALFFKWLEYIFIFLIVVDTLTSRKRLRNAVAILLIVGVVVGIDGLFQRFSGWEFLRQKQAIQIKEGVYAITGPFKHYNDFAAYLVCVLPLAIALLFRDSPLRFAQGKLLRGQFLSKKMIYRAGLFFVVVLLGLCLLFTFSRGGWLGLLAAGLLMSFLSRKWKVTLTLICIFVLGLIVVPVIRERAAFTFQAGGDAGRFAIWQGAWAIIRENPFLGKGLGTFMEYFPRYTRGLGTQYAHNCYLQMWAEIGIFGLLSFLLFVGSVLYKGIRVFRKDSPFVLLGLICAIFGFLVHSFFDTQLYSLQLSVLFWFLLGMVARYGYPTT